MSTLTIPITQARRSWVLPDRGKVGMAGLIIAESGIFTIFVVAYLFYAGKSLSGPTPGQVLETPVFYTICLLSSSITVHLASKFLERGKRGTFLSLWLLTFILGGLFLFGTAQEAGGKLPIGWRVELIQIRCRTGVRDNIFHPVLRQG